MIKQLGLKEINKCDWGLKDNNPDPNYALRLTSSAGCRIERDIIDKYLMKMISKKGSKQLKIFDGGCGVGNWLLYIKKKWNVECYGADIHLNKSQINIAKKYDINLTTDSILSLPYPDDSFDIYFSFGVFEHFEEGIEVPMTEAHRVIKRGGVLIISIPYINYLNILLWPIRFSRRVYTKYRYRDKLQFTNYQFTKKDIVNSTHKTNFKLIEIMNDEDVGVGLWLDFMFLRRCSSSIYPFTLNKAGRIINKSFNTLSPYFTTWGLICVMRKISDN